MTEKLIALRIFLTDGQLEEVRRRMNADLWLGSGVTETLRDRADQLGMTKDEIIVNALLVHTLMQSSLSVLTELGLYTLKADLMPATDEVEVVEGESYAPLADAAYYATGGETNVYGSKSNSSR